jgi:hypothetical protein
MGLEVQIFQVRSLVAMLTVYVGVWESYFENGKKLYKKKKLDFL